MRGQDRIEEEEEEMKEEAERVKADRGEEGAR